MAEDFADSITSLLTTGSLAGDRSGPEDILRAGFRASSGRSTFGEEMNRIKAQQLASEGDMFKLLERFQTRQQREAEFKQKQYDSFSTHFEKRFGKFPAQAQNDILAWLEQHPTDISQGNPILWGRMFSEAQRELGVEEPLDLGAAAPGAAIYDKKTGKVVGQVPQKPEKDSAFDAQVNAIMEEFKVDRKTAVGIKSGALQRATDPITGEMSIVDMTKGTKVRVSGDEAGIPRKTRTDLTNQNVEIAKIFSQVDELDALLEKGVGAVAVGKELAAKTLGQLPTAEVDVPGLGKVGTGAKAAQPAVIEARTKLKFLRQGLITALANNPRLALEQKRIEAMLPSDGVFESVDAARTAMETLRKILVDIMEKNEAIMSPGGKPTIAPDDEITIKRVK